ncbi:transcriptional regulator [Leptospira stimsonii]|uniref:Transcriptional regulator n=1 Tax=Leptospira stimsonii TaxID=2202203 RepID=A0A396Z191_9LEPT|nr:transcriptional regulator [Leptospira stimsonii]
MFTNDKQDPVFKALADSKRRKILDLLEESPMTTGEICAHFEPLDRCTVLQHLKILEVSGLLIVKREGRIRWNYLDSVPIQEIYNRWIRKYAVPSVERLTSWKKELETSPQRAEKKVRKSVPKNSLRRIRQKNRSLR